MVYSSKMFCALSTDAVFFISSGWEEYFFALCIFELNDHFSLSFFDLMLMQFVINGINE